MTDDLVKRLRFGVALDEQGDVSWCNQEIMFNAADRIDKLEAALRIIVGALEDPTGGQHVSDMRHASDIARKALEGKDE